MQAAGFGERLPPAVFSFSLLFLNGFFADCLFFLHQYVVRLPSYIGAQKEVFPCLLSANSCVVSGAQRTRCMDG
jgi:hypothetical protein